MCLVLVYRGEKKSSNEAHNLIFEGALPSSAWAHAEASTLARLDTTNFAPKFLLPSLWLSVLSDNLTELLKEATTWVVWPQVSH